MPYTLQYALYRYFDTIIPRSQPRSQNGGAFYSNQKAKKFVERGSQIVLIMNGF